MIPKEIKYNLHYGDVRGDVLLPPHDTTPATVEPVCERASGIGKGYTKWSTDTPKWLLAASVKYEFSTNVILLPDKFLDRKKHGVSMKYPNMF